MGSGTDIAMKAAAVVLMTGSLRKILDVFALAAGPCASSAKTFLGLRSITRLASPWPWQGF